MGLLGVNHKTIFWDVDTQFDFMSRQGKLYVPGADRIINKISEIRMFALENGFSIIASTDWHSPTDEEISQEPDFKNTFPQHCVAGRKDAERVGFLGSVSIDPVEQARSDTANLKELVDKKQFHIVIRKSKFDVFSNPNTAKLLELICPETVIVFGVALDVCVLMVVNALLQWGKADIIVLSDGVKGLGIKKTDGQILKEFEEKGVKVMRLEDMIKGMPDVVA